MITLTHVLNIVSKEDMPVGEIIKPLRRYFSSGEINFEVPDKKAAMAGLTKRYNDAQIDNLDGVTVSYKDWWFNCRPSNTEPLLRLNIEAKTAVLLKEKLGELQKQLGKPV
jgi:phosphomannomutase